MAKQVGFGHCADCGRETFLVVCLVNEAPHCKRAHYRNCMFQVASEDSKADMAGYLAASATFDPTGSARGNDDVHDD